ncbi:MAG: hypothetical protein H2069_07910 [Legionella sp.]|nr:hypothetical protein [Legionella sp.]
MSFAYDAAFFGNSVVREIINKVYHEVSGKDISQFNITNFNSWSMKPKLIAQLADKRPMLFREVIDDLVNVGQIFETGSLEGGNLEIKSTHSTPDLAKYERAPRHELLHNSIQQAIKSGNIVSPILWAAYRNNLSANNLLAAEQFKYEALHCAIKNNELENVKFLAK